MKNELMTLTLLATVTFTTSVFAKQDIKPIEFPPAPTSSVLHGAVKRGDSDKYVFSGKAGQQLSLKISSPGDHVAFHLYDPKAENRLNDPEGARESADAKDWTGTLPASGKYTLIVSSTRGDTEYKLSVGMK